MMKTIVQDLISALLGKLDYLGLAPLSRSVCLNALHPARHSPTHILNAYPTTHRRTPTHLCIHLSVFHIVCLYVCCLYVYLFVCPYPRGHPFMTSKRKSGFLPPLSTCVQLSLTPCGRPNAIDIKYTSLSRSR